MYETKFFRKEDRACHRELTQDEIFDLRDHYVSGGIRKAVAATEDSAERDRKVNWS